MPVRRSSGFTLVEVLVAILVLSFGMLGVVGLQAAAMQANKQARYQSSAVRLGRELAEMIRSNSKYAATYMISGTSAPPGFSTNCLSSSCGDSDAGQAKVASYEIAEWFRRASEELPGLRADVCFDDSPYDGGGMPQWACAAAAPAPPGQPIYIKLAWTQQTTNRAADGVSTTAGPLVIRADDARPLVVVPVVN